MRCRDAEPLLPQYADDALPAGQRDRLAAHLRECEACCDELEALHTALQSLNAAAPRAGERDLWSGFQTQLTLRASGIDCRRVQDLLPAYLEQEVRAGEHASITQHLSACPDCSAELDLLSGSLRALDAVSLQGLAAAPDLWASFSARRDAEAQQVERAAAPRLPCRQVDALLPEYLEGALDAKRSNGVRFHLEDCDACAAELALLERSLDVLESAAVRAPEVDLWPAFAARLAQEQESRRAPSIWPSLAALRWPTLPRLAFAPAMGLAAAVVVALVVRQAPSTAPQTNMAGVPSTPALTSPVDTEPEASPITPPSVETAEPVKPAPVIGGRIRPAAGRRLRSVRRPRRSAPLLARAEQPKRFQSRVRRTAPVQIARAKLPKPSPSTSKRAHGMEVAYNVTPDVSYGVPAELNSDYAQSQVMPEAVALVEQFVGVENAASQPFESE